MFIIVKNIKSDVKIKDIASLIKPAMKNSPFFKQGIIQSIKIILFLDKNRRIVEKHGLVRVANKPAKKVVSHLKKEGHAKGVEQQVDEYVIRMWSNDRRTNLAESSAYPNDRRKADRRRKGFKIVTVCEKAGVDTAGVATDLEFCGDTCSGCGWRVAPRRRSL